MPQATARFVLLDIGQRRPRNDQPRLALDAGQLMRISQHLAEVDSTDTRTRRIAMSRACDALDIAIRRITPGQEGIFFDELYDPMSKQAFIEDPSLYEKSNMLSRFEILKAELKVIDSQLRPQRR